MATVPSESEERREISRPEPHLDRPAPPRLAVLCDLGAEFASWARDRPSVWIGPQSLWPERWSAGCEGVVVRSGVCIDQAFLIARPNLRLVVRAGRGVDEIDVAGLAERGIELRIAPAFSARSVAELVLSALVQLARRVPEAQAHLRHGVWAKERAIGESTSELTVAVWGAGPVGRAVAEALIPAVGSVFFVDWPSIDPDLPRRPLEVVAASCDGIVLCLPLRAATRQIVTSAILVSLRRRPYLLNVGRHELLDFEAVVKALRAGDLRGLYLDAVNERDIAPVVDLLNGPPTNVLVSPHLGGQRSDVLAVLGRWVADQLEPVA